MLRWHTAQGIPTVPELLKRAEALETTLRHLAYFEPKKGGILSLGLARLAAGLKVGLKCGDRPSSTRTVYTSMDWRRGVT